MKLVKMTISQLPLVPDLHDNNEKLLSSSLSFGKDIFQRKGELMPMFIGVSNAHNVVYVVGAPWGDDVEKDAMTESIGVMFRQFNVQRYALITEVWMVVVKDEKDVMRPSEHPDRKEAIQVFVIDNNGQMIEAGYWIERDEMGKVSLTKMPPTGVTIHSGRMVELLIDPSKFTKH